MKAKKLAKWFLMTRPSLQNGYNDGNVKLNKLLFFSSLMYYAIKEEKLVEEPFEKWDRGPVIRDIYKAYRYEGLSSIGDCALPLLDRDPKQVLNIVDLIYGDMTADEISEESHRLSIWQETERNQTIDFSKLKPGEGKFMRNLYDLYRDFDFDKLGIEKIGGNKYFYDKSNLEMTEDIITKLESMPQMEKPTFLEDIDGELVFS